MKKLMLLFVVVVFSAQAFADEPVRAKLKIPVPQSGLQEVINEYKLDIERGGPDYIFGYLTDSEQSILRGSGIQFEILYKDYREESAWIMSLFDFGEYHSHDEVMFFLDSVATANSEICRLDTLGESVNGRAIVGIRISDNPNQEENEPEVRIMGAHHGDERISVELPLYLIDYITTLYGNDMFITPLVNSTEIFIIPMVNPDGVSTVRRYNSHGIDINRNYLCPEGDDCPQGADSQHAFSEPETQAIRDDALANRYVLSLSLHSGATNINTVWNYDDGLHLNGNYHETPDDALIMSLSEHYASLNTTSGFYVTNGCDWYSTHGDANDFSYGWLSDIDWTIELSVPKTPPQNQIENYWLDNRDAMLYIIASAGIGIYGTVTDSTTSEPLDATVRILEGGKPVYTDPIIGDYHRPLLPGDYHLRVEAPGYISKEFGPFSVGNEPAHRYDFTLNRAQMVALDLAVVDTFSQQPLDAIVEIRSGQYDTLIAYSGSPISLELNADIYDINVSNSSFLPKSRHLLLAGFSNQEFTLVPFWTEVLADDFENGSGNWIFGGTQNHWGIASSGHNSDHSLQDSPGNYSSNTYSYAKTAGSFELSGYERAGIHFWERHELQPAYDYLFTEISTNGGTQWQILPDTLTGYADSRWRKHYVSLDDFCGQGFDNIVFRFRFFSGPSVNYDGVYIDDLYFGGYSSVTGIADNNPLPEKISLAQNYPNPFNSSTVISMSGIDLDNPPAVEIFDLLGRRVKILTPEECMNGQYLWSGIDNSGKPVSSGIYFYKISGQSQIRSMTLLK